METSFEIPSSRPAPSGRLDESSVLVLALVVAGILSWLFLMPGKDVKAETERKARSHRLRTIAMTVAFPVDERMSRLSCGRYGAAREACMASEGDLRAEATVRWQAADRDDRLLCIGPSERAPGPVGYIYACLTALKDARKEERGLFGE